MTLPVLLLLGAAAAGAAAAAAASAPVATSVNIKPAANTQMENMLQMVSIQTSVPSLQELHLCNNNIAALSSTDPSGSIFPQLQVQ